MAVPRAVYLIVTSDTTTVQAGDLPATNRTVHYFEAAPEDTSMDDIVARNATAPSMVGCELLVVDARYARPYEVSVTAAPRAEGS